MDIKFIDLNVGAPVPSAVSTTPALRVGTRMRGLNNDTGQYVDLVYGKAGGTIAESAVCVMDSVDWTFVAGSANAIGKVGVAANAMTVGQYGWFVVGGHVRARVAASFAASAFVYWTASAGVVDDAAVAGDRIKGARGVSALDTVTGLATLFLQDAYADDGAAT